MLISISLAFSFVSLVLSLGALALAKQRGREILKTLEILQNFQWETVKSFHDVQDILSTNQIKMVQAIAREVTPLNNRLDELESSLVNVQKFVQ